MKNWVVAVLIILNCIYFEVAEVRASENEPNNPSEEELWYVGPRIGYSLERNKAFISGGYDEKGI